MSDLEGITQIIKDKMDAWDRAQTELHHIKYCAGMDILDAIKRWKGINNGKI